MEYIINNSLDPHFNLALEEYLFNLDNEQQYFWLWQNDNTIVIGKNQNAFNEINTDFVKKNNIKVARRITGGGAVYHDLGNLNFSFVTPSFGKKECDFKRFTAQIAAALENFGLKAEYSGRNDLLINDKKFSGNAQFVGKTKILHHGTLLFSSNLDIIEKCLTPPTEKLKSHGVSSVKSRVTNISEHLKINLMDFKNSLTAQICENTRSLTNDEIKAVKRLSDIKFSTYEWIYGSSPGFNYSKTLRFDGCGTINLCLDLKSGVIENCKITGDFFGSGDVFDIEEALKFKLFEKENILDVIGGFDLSHYFGRLDVADFLLLF